MPDAYKPEVYTDKYVNLIEKPVHARNLYHRYGYVLTSTSLLFTPGTGVPF